MHLNNLNAPVLSVLRSHGRIFKLNPALVTIHATCLQQSLFKTYALLNRAGIFTKYSVRRQVQDFMRQLWMYDRVLLRHVSVHPTAVNYNERCYWTTTI